MFRTFPLSAIVNFGARSVPVREVRVRTWLVMTMMAAPAIGPVVAPAAAQTTVQAGTSLPAPSGAPLAIDFAQDPVLKLGQAEVSPEAFRRMVADSVMRHPSLKEAEAGMAEAEAGRGEARAALFPTVELALIGDRSLARNFSNDPDNLIERSRPRGRTDATANIQQRLFDFGATSKRIEAAGSRLRAASFDVEQAADQVALRTIAAWYDVYAYRALVGLGEAMGQSQRRLADAVRERVRQGVAAEGDVARVEAYVATADSRTARYRRALATAEARLEELIGRPAPDRLDRPAMDFVMPSTREAVSTAAVASPIVRSAEARAAAARYEATATRRDMLPSVNAAINAGRYGVFENHDEYDVRGRLILNQRFFGGADSRADQARARAAAADAAAERVRDEAVRDANIAFADVRSLELQLKAVQDSYIANRRSRDVLAERFRVARGTLFDVLTAEDDYFDAAAGYVQALTELDAARFILLSRSGRLLDTMGVEAGGDRLR